MVKKNNMDEEKKLNIGREEILKIKMTHTEKKRLLDTILQSASKNSSISPYSFLLKFGNYRIAYGVFASFLLVILGTGIVSASKASLPGSVLYPLKVDVIEPINKVLLFSPLKKIQYESDLAESRLVEAETLANQGRLDIKNETKLNSLLELHAKNLNEEVEKRRQTSSENNTENEDEIITDFAAKMNAHAGILDVIQDDKNTESNEITGRISETARKNADRVNILKNKKENEPGKYKKKKEVVQSIIDSTEANLNQQKTDISGKGKTVINNTKKTLENARTFLREAEEENKKEDREKAFEKLLDSENSAKEADIFLKTGLELEKKD